jgi:hypothetical protein
VTPRSSSPCTTRSTSPSLLPFFFFTLVTGPRRSLSLKLSDTRVHVPQIRARLVTTTHSASPTIINLPSCVRRADSMTSVWERARAHQSGRLDWTEIEDFGFGRMLEFRKREEGWGWGQCSSSQCTPRRSPSSHARPENDQLKGPFI